MSVSLCQNQRPLPCIARGFLLLLFILLPLVAASMALWYRVPAPWTWPILALWGAAGLTVFTGLLIKRRRLGLFIMYLLMLALFVGWWVSIKPRSDRDWAPEVSRIVSGSIDGPVVTLHNVRNFHWRSLTNYDAAWETRSYNIDDIKAVDLFMSYWGMPAIAHTLVGFTFANGDHVVFSVEIRKEKGEQYSDIAGFFKEYEISLIAADERDIIYLRTNVRGEDVYHYEINMPDAARKQLFLSYLNVGNKLNGEARFYNTITANCTTVVFRMLRAIIPSLHIDPRVILSGYLPGYLYKIGGIPHDKPLDDVISGAAISAKGKSAGDSPHYSDIIRE